MLKNKINFISDASVTIDTNSCHESDLLVSDVLNEDTSPNCLMRMVVFSDL